MKKVQLHLVKQKSNTFYAMIADPRTIAAIIK